MGGSALTFDTASWSEHAESDLAPAMAADPLATIDTLKAAVDRGDGVLFKVMHDGQTVAHFVLAMEDCERGREAVLAAGGGRLAGGQLVRDVVPWVAQWAKACGADFLRMHTSRAAFWRILPKLGFLPAETVWRKNLKFHFAVSTDGR